MTEQTQQETKEEEKKETQKADMKQLALIKNPKITRIHLRPRYAFTRGGKTKRA